MSTVGNGQVHRPPPPFTFQTQAPHSAMIVFIKVVINTGATSSLMKSTSYPTKAGNVVQPTDHSASQLDRSSIAVAGEVKFNISIGSSK